MTVSIPFSASKKNKLSGLDRLWLLFRTGGHSLGSGLFSTQHAHTHESSAGASDRLDELHEKTDLSRLGKIRSRNNGIGVPKDPVIAYAHFNLAAATKDAPEEPLSVFYRRGLLGQKDLTKAFELSMKAVESGDIDGTFDVAYAYAGGLSVEKNIAKAIEYYQKSGESGDSAAWNNLGVIYLDGNGVEKDTKKAMFYYQKAADLGNAMAMKNLGVSYIDGIVVPKDIKKGVKYLKEAEVKGLEEVHYSLGWLYDNGIGVPKDPVIAYAHFNLAAATKDAPEDAAAKRNSIGSRLTPSQLEKAQGLSSRWKPGISISAIATGKKKGRRRVWALPCLPARLEAEN
jgi:TPR repeat protein